PAFSFEKTKNDSKTQQFITLLYPYDGNTVPDISVQTNTDNDYEKGNISVNIIINGKKSEIKTSLK
ncbi:MAG: hypothetical protein ACN6OI_23215, partial [Flavobacterium sp.]|uniref:hypothetical protein n=1 Tax=Flavobacterium sp. TaxID=239 RepID=UPI003D0D3AC8